MATTQRTVAVGVFSDAQSAQRAVTELRRLGFREDQIGVAARDAAVSGGTAVSDKGAKAASGAAAGAATGAGLGALWGIGILAGVLPAIGPAIAGGTLATILSSAAAGAAVASMAGALIGLGLSEEEAKYYEGEFKSGRIVVTVKADGRYDEALATLRQFGGYDISTRQTGATAQSGAACVTAPTGAAGKTVQVKEEQLKVHKQPVQTGEVTVRKEVHTEHKTVQVPVEKEEVVIDRRPVAGGKVSATDIKAGEQIRVAVREDQVHVEKQPVVKEEVTVGKRTVRDTEQVGATVRKEEVKVEKKGDVDVRVDKKNKK
jgi:uncharacterized protein (TIGR02271 family)